MAWTDTCKIEACHQIDSRRQQCGGAKPAMRELSKESGIPIETLKRWYWKEKNGVKNDPATDTAPEADSQGSMETCATDDLFALIQAGKKFSTVYADPPWKYGNQATRSSTNNHYSTMTIDEICQLPVCQLTLDDAHLHLWTTNAFIFESRKVIEAWGFNYKSCLVWVKPQMGIGNYWRVSHEFLMFGLKGKSPFKDRSQMSWIHHERTKHSQKPNKIRKTIELVSPGPRIELFARVVSPGWTCWGNEIERTEFNKYAFI